MWTDLGRAETGPGPFAPRWSAIGTSPLFLSLGAAKGGGLLWESAPVVVGMCVGVVGCSGGVLLSHDLSVAVPSALEGLASGFGMGPGVSPPL